VNQSGIGMHAGGDVLTIHGRTSQFTVEGYGQTFTVHIDTGTTSTKTAFMLIDLSDTSNWKHTTGTDHISLDMLLIEADPSSQYLGEIKLGFLSNVDGTNGDLNIILDIDLRQKADLIIEEIEYGTHGFHLRTSSHFGPIEADDVLWQTDVDLRGPDGGVAAYPSGNGDMVMLIERSAGDIDVSITLGYETV